MGAKRNWRVGFTGTRMGMAADQMTELRRRLSPPVMNWGMFSEFHHGDCVGADEQAHDMMRVLLTRHWPTRVDIHIHPPKDKQWRARCDALMDPEELRLVHVWEEDEYLARDRAIVDNTDLLIGCPRGYDLRSHGGTAYTVRYALSKGKPVVIIWADGSVELKNLPAGEAGEAGDMDTEEMWKKPGKETTRNA